MGNATTPVDEARDIPSSVTDSSYILVVDDDQAILSVVMLLLETEGYTGIGFSESHQVLPFLQHLGVERKPRMILLDLMMPGVSGYDIATWLSQHEQYATLPIVVMTADNRVHDVKDVRGAADLVHKPFQLEKLLQKIAYYICTTVTA